MPDTLWEGERYRLYTLDSNGKPQGKAEAPDALGLGLAIITLAEENRLAGEPADTIGILDWHAHVWLCSPWISRKHTPFL